MPDEERTGRLSADEMDAAATAWAERTATAQGLPVKIEDPGFLAMVARFMGQSSEVAPLLLGAVEAAAVCGVSRSTFNEWVRTGVVPSEVRHPVSYGGWPRYSRVRLEQWLAQ